MINLQKSGATVSSVTVAGGRLGAADGGGIAIASEGGTIRNSLFTRNNLDEAEKNALGGTVYLEGNAVLENCTVVSNLAAHVSGALLSGSTARVRNCVISANATVHGNEQDKAYYGTDYCISRCVSDVSINANCLVEDPSVTFRKPARGDWRLKRGSKAIDYGTYAAWMDGATDLAGAPRVQGKRPDAGCYEGCPGGLVLIVR